MNLKQGLRIGLALFIISRGAFAAPQGITFQGQLLKDSVVVESSTVDLTIRVTSMAIANSRPECVLFEETFPLNMTNSNGIFAVTLGTGVRTSNDLGLSVSSAFQNAGTLSSLNCVGAPTATAYTPQPTDSRNIYVSFVDGPDTVAFSAPYVIESVPYAFEAERLSSAASSGFIQTSSDTTQSKVDAIFASTPYAELLALINGTSTSFAGLAGGNLSLGSGKIGVGTTNPSSDLSFGGNVARNIAMERSTTSNSAGNNLSVTAGGATLSSSDKGGGFLNLSSGVSTGAGGSTIQFQTATPTSSGTTSNSPSTKMTILGNGSVGIGTTAPSTQLANTPYGIGDASTSYENSNGISWATSGGGYAAGILNNEFSDSHANGLAVNVASIGATNRILNLRSGIGDVMTVTANGNVGIGDNAPISKLVVTADTSSSGYEVSAHGFAINTGTSGQSLYMGYDGSVDAAYISSSKIGSYQPLLLNPRGGRVGIATASPNSALDVSGSLAAAGVGTENEFQISRPTNGGISYSQAAAFKLGTYAANSIANGYGPNTRLDINLKAAIGDPPNAETTVMTLLANGNVGIGTTSPAKRLHVFSTSQYDGLVVDGTNSVGINLDSNGASKGVLGVAVGNGAWTNTTNDGDIVLKSNSSNLRLENTTNGIIAFDVGPNATALSEAMRITSSGNVGIGTTSPASTFDVNGAISLRGTIAPSVAPSAQARMYFDSTSNQLMLSQNGGAYGSLLNTSGNQTIAGTETFSGPVTASGTGTGLTVTNNSSMGGKLDVAGTANVGQLTVPNGPNSVINAFNNYGNGVLNISQGNGFNTVSIKSFGPSAFGGGDVAITNGNLLATGGSVGIGTTSPRYNLDISGVVSLGGPNGNLDPNLSPSIDLTKLEFQGKNLIGSNYSGGDGESDFIANRGYGTVGGFRFYDYSNTGTATPLMTIQGGGRVGIGTVTPNETLEVTGSLRVNSASSLVAGTFAGSIDNTVTVIPVSSTTGFGSSGILWLDSEAVSYTGLTSNSFTGVSRGQLGTSAVPHNGCLVRSSNLNILSNGTSAFTVMNDGSVQSNTSTSRGLASIALGYGSQTSGSNSVALGTANNASGYASLALGSSSQANGQSAVAIGSAVKAPAYNETVMGTYNTYGGETANAWVATDPLFVIGNGQSASTPSTAFQILKNGKVGIGTTSPTNTLSVVGGINADGLCISDLCMGTAYSHGYVTGNGFRLGEANGGANNYISSPINVGATAAPKSSLDVTGGMSVGSYAGVTAAPANGLIVSGNVGIGTTSPGAQLQVGASANTDLAVASNTSNKIYLGTYGDNFGLSSNRRISDGVVTDASKAQAQLLLTAAAGDGHIAFHTTNINNSYAPERMRVDSSGNVGIGTSNPQNNLDVSGSADVQGWMAIGGTAKAETSASDPTLTVYGNLDITSGGSLIYYGGGVRFYSNAGGISGNSGSTLNYNITNSAGSRLGVNTSSNTSTLDVAGSASFGTYGGVLAAPTNGMIVSGNVGIGTSSPTTALTVNGAIVSLQSSPSVTGSSPSWAANLAFSATNAFSISPTFAVANDTVALTFTGTPANGANYLISFKDTASINIVFSAASCGSIKYKPLSSAANTIVTTGSGGTLITMTTIYNGSTYDCYVTWASGYQ